MLMHRALSTCWLALLALSACHRGEPLAVLLASPSGQLDAAPQWIEVRFDRPIIDPDAPDPHPIDLDFRIEPPLPGELGFPTPSSLAYSFAGQVPPAREYTVTIEAGLRSADYKAVLKSSHTFSFISERNAATAIYRVEAPAAGEGELPHKGDWRVTNLDLDDSLLVTLRFADKVERVRSLVKVLGEPMAGGEAQPLTAKLVFPAGDTVDRFVISPEGNWPKHTNLQVRIAPGLMVSGIPAGPLATQGEEKLDAATYGPIRVVRGPDCDMCRPPATLLFELSTPVDCDHLLPHLRIEPAADALRCAGQASPTAVRVEPVPALAAYTAYTVAVEPGVVDKFGQELQTASRFTLKTGDANPRFAHQLMFNVLERKLGAPHEEKVYRAAKLKVEGARLPFAEAWKLIAAEGLAGQVAWAQLPWWLHDDYGYYQGSDCYWDEQTGEEVCTQNERRHPGATEAADVAIPNAVTREVDADPTGWSVVQVGLDPFLQNKGGLVVTKSTPLDDSGNRLANPVLRLLNVTDIGLSAKYSPAQLVVLAARLSDGKPLAGVAIEVYRPESRDATGLGEPAAAAVTGDDGVAVLTAAQITRPGEDPSLQGRGVLVAASLDDDQAFVWSSFESGGRRASPEGPGLAGKVYTERGVYRPGETVYYRVVARKQVAGGFATPQGEVEIKVRRGAYWYGDDEEDQIFATTGSLNDFGTAAGRFTVPADARVGEYGIAAFIDGQRLSSSFKVAEFRRAELEVTVNTDRPEYVRGDELQARVNADYLFGAPAAGLDLRWTLRRTWGYFVSRRFPQARFSDQDNHTWWDERSTYSEFVDEGTTKLDADGSFLLTRRLDLAATRGKIEDLVVSATVDDASGQSVSSRRTVHVHPADFHAGIIPHGYLKEKDKLFSFEVVAVSPEDEPMPQAALEVSLHQDYWYSVKRKGPGGRLYWDYRRETIEEPSVCRGRTDDNGVVKCQYTPSKGGSIRLRVEGKDGQGRRVRASTWLWVTGDPEYYGGRTDRGNQVGIMSEKPEADVGAVARVAITSPFREALALITVEREDILWRKTLPIGSNAVVEIPIQASWVPNVYVSATVVRGRVTPEGELQPDPERDKPAYALGYLNLKVKPTRNALSLDVRTDRERYEPADTVTATVAVRGYNGEPAVAEVNLYAVDEGVLMLTGYKTPDLIPALFAARPYSVLALDTRMHVLGRRQFITPVIKGEEDGGGGDDGSDQSESLRQDFNPVATWVGSLVTGADGKAKHTFEVPDTLTTYRLMAVALTKGDRFGSGESELKVSKTLMMRQAMPRFARPGDRMQAGVVVNQLSGADAEVSVEIERLDAGLFKVRGARKLERMVGAKETAAFRFELEAADAEGASEIIFAARMGEHRDRVQLVLPVKRLQPRESRSIAGVLESGSVSHTLTLPPGARPIAVEVNMSGLPVASLEEKVRNLVGYPYGCLEQRTSKILPLVAIRELADKLAMKSIPTGKIQGWVEEWVGLVPKYRCADDGFDYYPGCGSGSDPYLTAFALDGLVTARRFGYEVPDALIDPAAAYLEAKVAAMTGGGSSWDGNSSGLAGALRVLAQLGRGKPGVENSLFERRAGLPLFAKTDLTRAVFVRTGERNAMVDTLLSEVLAGGVTRDGLLKFPAADQERYWWAWDSDLRSTALVLRTLLEVEPADARVPLIVRGLVELDNENSYHATQGVTQSLLALAEAAERLSKMKQEPVVTLGVAGRQLLKDQAVGSRVEQSRVEGAALGTGPFELALTNSGQGPLYFGGFLHYAFPATMRLPAKAEGFRVERTYTDRHGRPLGDRVKVGDFVKVSITVWPKESGRMVVVDDPLPAGLEPVDTSLETSDTEMAEVMEAKGDWSWWRSRYRELRDDRTEWHFRQLYAGGSHPVRLSYIARAVTAGTFHAPGTMVERMYQPHIRGRGPARDLVVEARD